MKTKATTICLLALAGAATLALAPSVHAVATVTLGGYSTVASGGTAPGSASNYDFFGGSQPVNLTNFTLQTAPPSEYSGNASYSSLKPPGGASSFTTGLGYSFTLSTVDLATFTAGASVLPGTTYSVAVLYGNSDGTGVFDSSINLRVNAGGALTASVVDTKSTNDFVRFNITGLNPGDTVTIGATAAALDGNGNNNKGSYIGGVTFGVVPEPSTWAAGVLVVCAGAWTLRRRLRRA